MREASLEIIDESGVLGDAQRALMRETLAAALGETGRFRVLAPGPAADWLFAARVARTTSSASGQPCWRVSLDLLEAGSRRSHQSYEFSVSGPAELWLAGAFLQELAYRYAPPDNYPDLAKKAGLVGKVEHPKLQSRDPELLSSLLLAELENLLNNESGLEVLRLCHHNAREFAPGTFCEELFAVFVPFGHAYLHEFIAALPAPGD